MSFFLFFFFFSSRRRHTRCSRDWSSDVCSSDLLTVLQGQRVPGHPDFRQLPRLAKQRLDRLPLLLGEAERDAIVVGAEPVVLPFALFGRRDIAKEMPALPTAGGGVRGQRGAHCAKFRNLRIATDRVHRASWTRET